MIEEKEEKREKTAEETDLEKCERERKEYLEGWQRAKADFLNYRKDEARRLEDMARFVVGGMISDILPVLDSFDLALKNSPPGQEQSILLIRAQMMDILKKRGFGEIPVKAGDKFEPEKHESLGEMEADYPEGSIAEEVQKGYMLRDRVLRPVRVRLTKNKQ